jgi:hypothetical protein
MMGGWKTWVAAIGLIASGIGMIATGFVAEPMNFDMIVAGWGSIMAGLALVGIGHKLEKNKVS